MENVYSSESRNVAPKFVIFRTALFSLLLVGTLATVSEVVSFAYIEIAQLDNFLCFIWPGLAVSFFQHFLFDVHFFYYNNET